MIIILGYFRVFVILTMIKGIKKENVCKFCIEGIQQCNMKNRDIYWRRYKIQETLYIGQDASVPFKIGTLGPHTVLPIALSYPIVFSWISSIVWNPFHFKSDFSFGKAGTHRAPNLGVGRPESPGCLDVSPKTSAQDVMHEWACCDEAASHQLPIGVAFWIIWTVSTEGCSTLMQNLMQICCSTLF